MSYPRESSLDSEFGQALRLLARSDAPVDRGWSTAFIWKFLSNPRTNPRNSNHFEIGNNRYVAMHDASELLRRYIALFFAGSESTNPSEKSDRRNPFLIWLQRRTFRRDTEGRFTEPVDQSDDPIVEPQDALHVTIDPPPDSSGFLGQFAFKGRRPLRDLPAVLRRQVFHTSADELLTLQSIVADPHGEASDFAPCLAVTNGQNGPLDFDLRNLNFDGGPVVYNCVAICCYVQPDHYVAYVRRSQHHQGSDSRQYVWWRCSDLRIDGPWDGMVRCSDLLEDRETVRFALFQLHQEHLQRNGIVPSSGGEEAPWNSSGDEEGRSEAQARQQILEDGILAAALQKQEDEAVDSRRNGEPQGNDSKWSNRILKSWWPGKSQQEGVDVDSDASSDTFDDTLHDGDASMEQHSNDDFISGPRQRPALKHDNFGSGGSPRTNRVHRAPAYTSLRQHSTASSTTRLRSVQHRTCITQLPLQQPQRGPKPVIDDPPVPTGTATENTTATTTPSASFCSRLVPFLVLGGCVAPVVLCILQIVFQSL